MMNIFNKHPESLNETYGEHLLSALVFSGIFFVCSIIVTIHALFPFIFKTTATDLLMRAIKKNRPGLLEKNTEG